MAYTYPNRNRSNETEVLVFEGTVDNSTAASGVKTVDIPLPPGAYSVGVGMTVTTANQTCTVKAYAYANALQNVKSGALYLTPYDSNTAATAITIAPSVSVIGDVGGIIHGSTIARDTLLYPYGLQLHVTCDTDSGSHTYKVIAQQRT